MNNYRYNILERMDKFDAEFVRDFRSMLCTKYNVSMTTLYRWFKADKTDMSNDIPAMAFMDIANWLHVQPRQLINPAYEPEQVLATEKQEHIS